MTNLAFGLWVTIAREVASMRVSAVSVNCTGARRSLACVAHDAWLECANDDLFGGPTLNGAAYCNGCQHKWIAVAAVPAPSEFECPSCHALKGVFTRHVIYTRQGLSHWHCLSCDGLLFSVVRSTTRAEPVLCCANCGSAADLIDAFPGKM